MTADQHPDPVAVARYFFDMLPHGCRLGIELVGASHARVQARLPYRRDLVGDPGSGHVHGGVLTTLIDQASGVAAVVAIQPPEAVATLDLRVDHLRAARPGEALYCSAECYRVTRNVAFVRCTAHDGDEEHPIAVGMGSFMRTGRQVVP